MFIPDMPNAPPQYVPVMIVQANQAQAGDVTAMRTIGVCKPAPSHEYSGENGLSPLSVARFYLRQYEQRSVTGQATTSILQQPKHGILRLVGEADRGTLFDRSAGALKPDAGLYAYLPEKGYAGKDSAAILVDFGGVKVKVVYFFEAIEGGLGNDWQDDYCSEKGVFWKISSTLDSNGNTTINSVEYLPADGTRDKGLTFDIHTTALCVSYAP